MKPKSKARKSTGAGRYKKPKKADLELTKLRRVQHRRKEAVEKMGEMFLRDNF